MLTAKKNDTEFLWKVQNYPPKEQIKKIFTQNAKQKDIKMRKDSKGSGASGATPMPITRLEDCDEFQVQNQKLSLFKGGISKLNMRIKK